MRSRHIALGCMHNGRRPFGQAGDGGAFVNGHARRLGLFGQGQHIAQRVQMPGPPVQNPADIARRFDQMAHRVALKDVDLGIGIGGCQMLHLGPGIRRFAAGIFAMRHAGQIAGLGRVFGAKIADLLFTGLGNIPQCAGFHRPQAAFQPQLTFVEPRSDLPAVAP